MFSIRVAAADVDWQIRLIEHFPDIADRHFKPAMSDAVGRLAREIEPNIPIRTGTAAAKFRDAVTGKGMRLTGRVGWWGAGQPWYINVVEYGAKEHEIPAGGGQRPLHLVGGWVMGPVHHPGFGARNFMRKADEATRQRNVERFEQARDKTVSDMTVKGKL